MSPGNGRFQTQGWLLGHFRATYNYPGVKDFVALRAADNSWPNCVPCLISLQLTITRFWLWVELYIHLFGVLNIAARNYIYLELKYLYDQRLIFRSRKLIRDSNIHTNKVGIQVGSTKSEAETR